MKKTKKKPLILHMGLQKTGTSSVQVMLASSAAALEENGYIYPTLPKSDGHVWNSPFRHNIIAATYSDFPTTFDRLSVDQELEFWSSLKGEEYTPILSAEEFSRQKNFTPLYDAMEDFDITAVIYLRRQDKFAESLYNQRNKILVQNADPRVISSDLATEKGLFDFLRAENYGPLLNYEKLLERVEQQLKPARIVIREFDRGTLKGGDVCRDFLDILGLPPERMSFPSQEANESLSNDALHELVAAAEQDGLPVATDKLNHLSRQLSEGAAPTGSYQVLSAPTRRKLLKDYRDINTAIRDRYGVVFSGYDYS